MVPIFGTTCTSMASLVPFLILHFLLPLPADGQVSFTRDLSSRRLYWGQSEPPSICRHVLIYHCHININHPSQTSDMIDIRRDSYWWSRKLIWTNSNGDITILIINRPISIIQRILSWRSSSPSPLSSPSSDWRRSWLLARGSTWLCSSSTTRTRRARCSRLAVRLPPSPSSSSACTHRHRRRHLISPPSPSALSSKLSPWLQLILSQNLFTSWSSATSLVWLISLGEDGGRCRTSLSRTCHDDNFDDDNDDTKSYRIIIVVIIKELQNLRT